MDIHSDSALLQELTGESTPRSLFDVKEEVFIRHPAAHHLWRSFFGSWVDDRRGALRFETNVDALTYCRAAGLDGVLVGFSGQGAELYEIEADTILRTFAHTPRFG